GAVNVLPGEHEGRPSTVFAGAEESLGLAEPPRSGKKQCERAVRGRLVEYSGGEGDRYAALLGGGHVDVVVAGAHRGDHPQLLRSADRIAVHRIRWKRIDDVRVSDEPQHLVGSRDRWLAGADRDVAFGAQDRQRFLRDWPRHNDLHERERVYAATISACPNASRSTKSARTTSACGSGSRRRASPTRGRRAGRRGPEPENGGFSTASRTARSKASSSTESACFPWPAAAAGTRSSSPSSARR